MARATAPVTPASSPRPSGVRGEVNHWIVPLTLVAALLYLLAAWTIDAVSRLPSMGPIDEAAVTFRVDTDYGVALADVTSLGLRLANPCYELAITSGDTRIDIPSEAISQEAQFTGDDVLTVAATIISPPNWQASVAALPDVSGIITPVIASCFKLEYGGRWGQLLTEPPAPRPAALQFASSVAYDDALRVAAEHGLRLADPCYEAAVEQGKRPTWHSESQQASFARNHALTVAPTILTPNDWLLHLPSDVTPGPVIVNCP